MDRRQFLLSSGAVALATADGIGQVVDRRGRIGAAIHGLDPFGVPAAAAQLGTDATVPAVGVPGGVQSPEMNLAAARNTDH